MQITNGRLFLGFIMIIMVLMRLVWMQLRSYQFQWDPRASLELTRLSANHERPRCGNPKTAIESQFPKQEIRHRDVPFESMGFQWFLRYFCKNGDPHKNFFIKANQTVVIMVTILLCLFVRFLTGSWIAALIAAVILMSRGRFIAFVGTVSPIHLTMLLSSFWFLFVCHFFRTGDDKSFFISFFWLLLLSLVDRSFIAGLVILPLFLGFGLLIQARIFSKKIPPVTAHRNDSSFQSALRFLYVLLVKPQYLPVAENQSFQPGFLRSSQTSFILWYFRRGYFHQTPMTWCLLSIFLSLASLVALYYQNMALIFDIKITLSHVQPWLNFLLNTIDRDLFVSLAIILLSMCLHPHDSFPGCWEVSCFFWFCLFLLLPSAFFVDLLEFQSLNNQSDWDYAHYLKLWSRGPDLMVILEPVILSLGIVGILNFIKILLTKKKSSF